MKTCDDPDVTDLAAGVRRHAWVVLLLRGTGIACAGGIAVATLGVEHDPVWRWAAVPLGVGILLALVAFLSMRRGKAGWVAIAFTLLVVLAWVFLALTPVLDRVPWWKGHLDPFGLGKEPLALALLPAFFLPDLFALWVFLRLREPKRGHLLVSRGMIVLSALSSIVVSWVGPAIFLA